MPEGVLRVERGLGKALKTRLRVIPESTLMGIEGEQLNQTGYDLDSLAHDRVQLCLEAFKKTLIDKNGKIGR